MAGGEGRMMSKRAASSEQPIRVSASGQRAIYCHPRGRHAFGKVLVCVVLLPQGIKQTVPTRESRFVSCAWGPL